MILRGGIPGLAPCDRCKATTPWAFSTDPATEAVGGGQGRAGGGKHGIEMRRKGRVPLKLQIKVVRDSLGYSFEEICTTLNVSRGGACFETAHQYAVGEDLKIFMPYKERELGISVPAYMVRRNALQCTPHPAVAIQLEEGPR